MRYVTQVVSSSLLLCAGALAQEWSQFRGPNGTGVSRAQGMPSQWSDDQYAWTVDLPGRGHSSPVLWGNRLFITAGDPETGAVRLLCLNGDSGKELWRRETAVQPYRQHRYNELAAATPAADADHVYFYQPAPQGSAVLAYNHDGELQWKRSLGGIKSQHGGATSPIVYQDKVILAHDHLDDSFLVALDRRTGDVVWKTERKTAGKTAYGIPSVYAPGNEKPSLIFNSEQHGISAVDPASGGLIWEIDNVFDKRSVSSSVIAGGLMFGSCGSGGGGNYLVAVRPGDRNGKKPKLAYQIRRSAGYVPTSVAYGGLLFMCSDGGVLSCVDIASGKPLWSERLGGGYFSSPIWVDGRVICVSTDGDISVVAAGKEFEVLGRASLDETCHATPAVANRALYLRTLTRLYCLKGKDISG